MDPYGRESGTSQAACQGKMQYSEDKASARTSLLHSAQRHKTLTAVGASRHSQPGQVSVRALGGQPMTPHTHPTVS